MGNGGIRWLGRLFLLLFLGLACAIGSFAVDVNSLPKPTGYVSDLAHVINDTDKDKLEAFCAKVEQQLGVQLAIVTIDTVGDQPIRDFALNLSRKWGVGDRKTNQGVLLLLAVKDRKNDVETGRGTEPYLTDGFSGSTLRAMRPELQAGDYGAALRTAAREMANQIAQGKGIAFSDDQLPAREERPRSAPQSGGIPISIFIVGVVLLLWLFGRGGRRGGGMRGGGGGGFWTGMLLGNILSSGGRSSGGNWGSGGGFGGDSGGGGGFGGFGGGDFGGGGASSDW